MLGKKQEAWVNPQRWEDKTLNITLQAKKIWREESCVPQGKSDFDTVSEQELDEKRKQEMEVNKDTSMLQGKRSKGRET